MFDQMTMAARSCPANIAEGISRKQTSLETGMKLIDVARATLSELLNDYIFWSMVDGIEIWDKDTDKYKWVGGFKLNTPIYTDDWTREAQQHILSEYERLRPALDNECNEVAINSAIILCNRTIRMLDRLLETSLDDFKQHGGFTENLTQVRLEARTAQSMTDGAPTCPKCGFYMIKRTAKKGLNSGRQFWSCSKYPDCSGTRRIEDPQR